MKNMPRNRRLFAIICALFLLTACADALPPQPQVKDVVSIPNHRLSIELVSIEPCELVVVISEPGKSGEVLLSLWAEPGLLIDTPSPLRINMFSMETQKQRITCRLDPDQVVLAGSYQVIAQANMVGGGFDLTTDIKLEIAVDGYGARLLSSAENGWPNNVAFTQGISQFDYAFVENGEDRSSGLYIVRAHGTEKNSAPTVILEMSSSVTFPNNPSPNVVWLNNTLVEVNFQQMAVGGTRIAKIPVHVVGAVTTGQFGMQVRPQTRWGTPVEASPIGIAVSAENGAYHLTSINYTPLPTLGADTVEPSSEIPVSPESFIGGGSQIVWDVQVNNLAGTLEDAFELTPGLGLNEADWQLFATDIGKYNPDLVTDGWRFLAEKTYLLPRRPAITQ